MFLKIYFNNFFPNIYKCLKYYRLNIIKNKKTLKKARNRYQRERYKNSQKLKNKNL